MTFFKGSRYATVGEIVSTDAQGRPIRYKRTRFISDPPLQGTHVVTDGERLDRLAAKTYGDVHSWWVIADANDTMWPEDLLSEPGDVIGMPWGQA
jgi:hypothetical protein